LNLGVWVMVDIVNQNQAFQGLAGSNLSKDP